MPITVVDIADMAVSRDPGGVLITYSLGSCIGVALWDPVVKVGGVLHFMLPESQLSPEKARHNPSMFCDTGVPKLFHVAGELGATKERLVVRVAGGAQLLGDNGTFNIGKRNYQALRKILSELGVLIQAQDVGGTVSRTMRLDVGSGALTIKSSNQEALL